MQRGLSAIAELLVQFSRWQNRRWHTQRGHTNAT